jgi:pyochelin biosynthetic protein PchC
VSPTSGPWFRVYWPRPFARTRLVIFPHGGGSASFYRPLAKLLGPDVEPVIVQYPGREDRLDEECVPDMATMADRITEVLLPLLDRQVVLFGHSMGASVAHEVSRRLLARYGRRPSMLVASGRPGPVFQLPGENHLDDDRLWAEVTRLKGTDTRLLVSEHVRQMVMPALRADYRLIETYRAPLGCDLDCPVAACVGDADDEVPAEESLAWRDATTGTFTSRVFRGDHFFLRPEGRDLAIWLTSLRGGALPYRSRPAVARGTS